MNRPGWGRVLAWWDIPLLGIVLAMLVGVLLAWTLTASPASLRSPFTKRSAEHPPARPTVTPTPRPTLTPTPMPTPAPPVALVAVDWDTLEPFRAAMRPAFASDIDAAARANRYVIHATLTVDSRGAQIAGAQRVRYVNRSPDPLREMVFRLYPNIPAMGGRMTVTQVWVGDQLVMPRLTERDTTLIIPLEAPLMPGQAVEITMTFDARATRDIYASYGAFGYRDGIFAAPEWYPALSVYRAGEGWWTEWPMGASDLIFSETALFDIHLTAPAGLPVVMTGATLAARPNGDGTVTTHTVTGPVRDVVIVASADFHTIRATDDGLTVSVTYLPGSEAAAVLMLDTAREALRIYGEAIAPYPFATFHIVEAFNFVGVEYPTMTVIAERHWRTPDHLEQVLVHEIAHQWFFSLVGTDPIREPWLDEALAGYMEYLYMATAHGPEAALALQQADETVYRAYRNSGGTDMRLNQPAAALMDDNYGALIFAKGPLFVLRLEQEVGAERLIEVLRAFFMAYRYQIANTNDLLAMAERVTGADLRDLFATWVGDFPS